ncbi:PaaI family thioesterase [Minwuia thermotolerans]|uniref:Aromatic catabolism protein n=1 Tax=Minwuia thermotolerans TaxID=2056226 RepID=A0A2M9FX82_9PROT|nr:PaaI family thioesterase [Minwuia thermotolerans]PJK28049.1 aromatic catabolism protein [Minwuia thermotolerans]
MNLSPYSTGFRPALAAGIHAMPSSAWLGLRCIGFADGRSAIEMPIRSDITFDGRIVQGAVVGVLADYAAVSAATAACPDGWRASTTGYNVHNIAPAAGERLVAFGQIAGRSRTSASSRADVYAVTGDKWTLAATCLATCRLIEPA